MNLNLTTFKNNLRLLRVITEGQLKSRYRSTVAGFLWVILSPVITYTVQALIFKNILNIQIGKYHLFLLSGVLPWTFIVSSLTVTVNSFVANRTTLMAFSINPIILLVSQIVDCFINYVCAFLVLLLLLNFNILGSPEQLFFFLIANILLVIFVFLISFCFAITQVFLRDTQYIIQFSIGLLYFITPIFYPPSLLPEKFQFLLNFNIFYIFIQPFQNSVWKYSPNLLWPNLAICISILIFLAFLSAHLWKKLKYEFYLKL